MGLAREDTGDLVALELWSASKVLPEEFVAELPRLEAAARALSAGRLTETAVPLVEWNRVIRHARAVSERNVGVVRNGR